MKTPWWISCITVLIALGVPATALYICLPVHVAWWRVAVGCAAVSSLIAYSVRLGVDLSPLRGLIRAAIAAANTQRPEPKPAGYCTLDGRWVPEARPVPGDPPGSV